jgi:hypothetical protein
MTIPSRMIRAVAFNPSSSRGIRLLGSPTIVAK